MLGSAVPIPQGGFSLAVSLFDQHVRQRGNLRRGLGQGGDTQHIAQQNTDILAALEARQQYRGVVLQRARPEAGEGLLNLFAGAAQIQTLVAQQALEKLGVVNQRLAEKLAITEDHQRVMDQEVMLVEAGDDIRGRRGQLLEEIKRRIRIGQIRGQQRHYLGHAFRHALADQRQVRGGLLRIAEDKPAEPSLQFGL